MEMLEKKGIEMPTGGFNEKQIQKILELFSERDEYSEMNYPSSQSMIKKAMKNADKSFLGKKTRAFKGKLKLPD